MARPAAIRTSEEQVLSATIRINVCIGPARSLARPLPSRDKLQAATANISCVS